MDDSGLGEMSVGTEPAVVHQEHPARGGFPPEEFLYLCGGLFQRRSLRKIARKVAQLKLDFIYDRFATREIANQQIGVQRYASFDE